MAEWAVADVLFLSAICGSFLVFRRKRKLPTRAVPITHAARVKAYADMLANVRGAGLAIMDTSALPAPKDEILWSLLMEGGASPEGQSLATIRAVLRMLAYFQPGVGAAPIWPGGIDGAGEPPADLTKFLRAVAGPAAQWERLFPVCEAEADEFLRRLTAIRAALPNV